MFAELLNHLPVTGVTCTGLVVGSGATLSAGQRVQSFAGGEAGTLQRVLRARAAIRGVLSSSPIDVIASHFALYVIGAMHDIGKYPHVVHFHGPWAAESVQEGKPALFTRPMEWIERKVYSRADRIIVLSKAFAEMAVQVYQVPADKIRVVPGSVDVLNFAAAPERKLARAALGWPKDKTILISVRRLSARMGLDRLIQAMRSVSRSFPDTLLYIGGRGHLERLLQQQIEEFGLEQNVKLLGFIPDKDLPVAYAAADLNVVPTLALEGFGLVAAEALAAGTPSLVTPVGGLPEVVAGLSSTLLFQSTSSEDIAQGIIEVLSGQRKLPTADVCKRYAAAHFSSALMAERTAAVYRELV